MAREQGLRVTCLQARKALKKRLLWLCPVAARCHRPSCAMPPGAVLVLALTGPRAQQGAAAAGLCAEHPPRLVISASERSLHFSKGENRMQEITSQLA